MKCFVLFFLDSSAAIYFVVSAVVVIIVLVLLPSLICFFFKRKQASASASSIGLSNLGDNTEGDHIYDNIYCSIDGIDEHNDEDHDIGIGESNHYDGVTLSVSGTYDHLIHHKHKPVGIYDFLYDRPHNKLLLWHEKNIPIPMQQAGSDVDIFDATLLSEAKHSELETDTYEHVPDVNLAHILSEAKSSKLASKEPYECVPVVNIARILSEAKSSKRDPQESDTYERVPVVNIARILSEVNCSKLAPKEPDTYEHVPVVNIARILNEAKCSKLAPKEPGTCANCQHHSHSE